MEKPVSIDLKETLPVLEAAAKRPGQKVLVGFSRRCEFVGTSARSMRNFRLVAMYLSDDQSYQSAKQRFDRGDLGKAYLIKSATNDMYDASGKCHEQCFVGAVASPAEQSSS